MTEDKPLYTIRDGVEYFKTNTEWYVCGKCGKYLIKDAWHPAILGKPVCDECYELMPKKKKAKKRKK